MADTPPRRAFGLPDNPTPAERTTLARFAAARRWGRSDPLPWPQMTLDQIIEALAVTAEVERRREASYRARAAEEAGAILTLLGRLLLLNDESSDVLVAKLTELVTLAEQERPDMTESIANEAFGDKSISSASEPVTNQPPGDISIRDEGGQ